MSIVLVCGKKRSGKSTLSKIFVTKYGYKEIALADNLKKVCQELIKFFYDMNININELHDKSKDFGGFSIRKYTKTCCSAKKLKRVINIKNDKTFTYRKLMQWLGTDILRHYFGDDIHINSILKDIDPKSSYIISDCRFQNEVDIIKKYGISKDMKVKIIFIKRNTNLSGFEHKSEEVIITGEDIIIENNGPIKNLEEIVSKLLK